jgi:UDP-3-O-[3-hydroxymyristoyl] glucosamine N-acyltransferase
MHSFPMRGRPDRTFRMSEAAHRLGIEVQGSGDPELRGLAPLTEAGPEHLSLVSSRAYIDRVPGSSAGGLLVAVDLERLLPDGEDRPRLVIDNPHRALADLLDWLHPALPAESGVHPTAVLEEGVVLGPGVSIAPYAVLEAGVRVGDGTRIGAHAVIGAASRIGAHCVVHPHVVLYPESVLGDEVILHSGVVIGSDGFGYVHVDGVHRKVPQVGRCELGSGVEIGANSTLDRGSIGDTRVEDGVKIDNLVQLGHNVVIGAGSILVSQTGVAGSTRFGRGVVAGGQSGFSGHLAIGDGAQLAAQAGVTGDIPAGAVYMGFPARPRTEFLKGVAAQGRVPDLLRRVRDLEARMEEILSRADPGDEAEGP